MEENIVKILESKIKKVKKELENSTVEQDEKLRKLNSFKKEINLVIADSNNIINIDVEKLKSLFDINVTDVKFLKFCKDMCILEIGLDDKQRDAINNLFEKLKSLILEVIENIEKQKQEILANDKAVKTLQELSLKIISLKSSGYLTSEDIAKLKEELIGVMDIDEIIDIIIYITGKSYSNVSVNEVIEVNKSTEEEIGVIDETNLEEEEVKKILEKYKYNFSDFSSSARVKILKYGNLENIESILNLLSKYNIFVNDYISKSPRLAEILCFSNTDIISLILNDFINNMNDNNNYSDELLNDIFLNCLNISNIFVKKKLFKRNKGGDGTTGRRSVVSGAYDNYIDNKELLIKLGVKDISKAIRRCSSFFVTPVSTNLKKIEAFDFYKIPVDLYINTLSSFEAPTPMRTIDRFIELGYFNYLSNNFSNVKKNYTSAVFYKLKRAQQLGIPREEIWRNEKELKGIVTIDKTEFLGVKGNNGALVVGEYRFEKDDPIYEIYDGIIYGEEPAASLTLVWNNFYIKAIEKYRDPNNEHIYNFNGVIISRYKVLRLYETLMRNKLGGTESAIIYSICKYSILTEEECQVIAKCIEGTFKNTRKVGKK